jgi:tetratricopeptide (TPR) repeat protein
MEVIKPDIKARMDALKLPWFSGLFAHTWDQLHYLISLGVSDIYVVEDLCFELPAVAKECHKHNIRVRVIPNVAQSSINASAPLKKFFIRPEDIDIYVNLGSAFYDKEDYNNALAVYRKALELQPHNPKIHCNLGFLYWGKADTEEAIKSYELAIKYNDRYDIAYNNLGVIYLDDLGLVNKALELFTKAVESNPSYALAYFNLARATTIIGDKIEAAKLYQLAQDINKVTQEIDPKDIADKISELFES